MRPSIILLLCLSLLIGCKSEPKEISSTSIGQQTRGKNANSATQTPVVQNIPLVPDQEDYIVTPVVTDLSNPWGMDWLPNGDLIYTEKEGRLFRFNGTRTIEIKGVPPVYLRGQGGLLDVSVHPNYDAAPYIYLSYASSEGAGKGGNTAIGRGLLKNNQLTEFEVLYKAVPNTTRGQHFGSRLAWDEAGYLYFTIGERGAREVNPQDLTRDGGKIYRIHADGSIPNDNPFINIQGAKTAAYTYGNRNPQGLTWHPVSKQMISHEHGPRGGDEINYIKAGANYGWPVISYGINYSGSKFTDLTAKKGMEQPMYYWTPSIAPSGFAILDQTGYGDWNGNFLVGSLKFQYLEMLYLEDQRVVKREKLVDGIGRLRNVKIGPDGLIYIGVEGKGIYTIKRKS